MKMSRRKYLKCVATLTALSLSNHALFAIEKPAMLTRPIRTTGEALPVIGLGTWQTFDVGNNSAARQPLIEVLKSLIAGGGTVVDSSPMYGSSEQVVGDLSEEGAVNRSIFMATKVWTSGKDSGIHQMENSLRLLKRKQMDLFQIHNLVDWQTHLRTLRDWKDKGRVRYIGITHYLDSAHSELEKIISREPIDFIQINYSLMDRNAEKRLLSVAQERNVSVLINRPFEEGALFDRVSGQSLPEWAKEFDCASWGQFFLKFILAQPAVNCVIPGTAKPKHLLDNLQAGLGKLPTPEHVKQMISLINR